MVELLPVGTRVRLLYHHKDGQPTSLKIGDMGKIVKIIPLPRYTRYEKRKDSVPHHSPYDITWDNGEDSYVFNIDQVAPVIDIVSVFRNRFLELE